jgi:hypothetical protein
MIELAGVTAIGDRSLALTFSDGSTGEWSAEAILARDTVLTRPLNDPAYFARAFVEAGALAWPNGLEFSSHALHVKLAEAGRLVRPPSMRTPLGQTA